MTREDELEQKLNEVVGLTYDWYKSWGVPKLPVVQLVMASGSALSSIHQGFRKSLDLPDDNLRPNGMYYKQAILLNLEYFQDECPERVALTLVHENAHAFYHMAQGKFFHFLDPKVNPNEPRLALKGRITEQDIVQVLTEDIRQPHHLTRREQELLAIEMFLDEMFAYGVQTLANPDHEWARDQMRRRYLSPIQEFDERYAAYLGKLADTYFLDRLFTKGLQETILTTPFIRAQALEAKHEFCPDPEWTPKNVTPRATFK